VERNALRDGLVQRAEAWLWSSLRQRLARHAKAQQWLHPGPVPLPADWCAQVNAPQTEVDLEAQRRSVARGRPFGSVAWQKRTAVRLGAEFTLKARGRPKKRAKPQGKTLS